MAEKKAEICSGQTIIMSLEDDWKSYEEGHVVAVCDDIFGNPDKSCGYHQDMREIAGGYIDPDRGCWAVTSVWMDKAHAEHRMARETAKLARGM